jgi:NADH-quinone oxidoreductase subunit M
MLAPFDETAPAAVRRALPGSAGSLRMGVDRHQRAVCAADAFLMPLCIIRELGRQGAGGRVYGCLLVLETLVIGVFTSLDMLLFYLFFEGGLIPMFLIIGVWAARTASTRPISSSSTPCWVRS